MATKFVIRAEDVAVLEQWVRSPTMSQEWALRAKILLATAEGEGVRSMARRLEVSPTTVCLWRERYRQSGLMGLRTQPRPGRRVGSALPRNVPLWRPRNARRRPRLIGVRDAWLQRSG